MKPAVTVTSVAQPHPDQVFRWDDRSTPEMERFELRWQPTPCRDCHGVVLHVIDRYYAYVELYDGKRTTERWAGELFQTLGAARAWVQDQLVEAAGSMLVA